MTTGPVAPHDVWVVTAAYNEARVIADVVADVRRAGYPAVVVDDGSTDGTAAAARQAGAAVLEHPINLGQGAALQTALEFALAAGAKVHHHVRCRRPAPRPRHSTADGRAAA